MLKKSLWKWLVLVVVLCGSLALIWPTDPKESWFQKIPLGLDLKGGTSFMVEIDEAAIRDQIREENKEISEQGIAEKLPARIADAQKRAVEVIRNRIDGLGIAEPTIFPLRNQRIVVQLPGVGEAKRDEAAKNIQSAAFLEFRLVHKDNSELVGKLFSKGLAPAGFMIEKAGNMDVYKRDRGAVKDVEMDRAFRDKMGRFQAPHGYELLMEKEQIDGVTAYRPYFVERKRQMTGETLKNARVDFDELRRPVVNVEFDAKGTKKFASVTSDYAPDGEKNRNSQSGRQLAIVLDGTLYSAPELKVAIRNGRAEISGNFTYEEASFLANILKAGSLPAPVNIIERRIVDPTLGSDTIHSGVSAGLYGCLAIFVFMAIYYMFSGLIADVALLLNVILLPLGMVLVAGVLGIFSTEARAGSTIALPVLTLPGIAGIALTIGMAVDANVLIFERIREELRAGKGFLSAVNAGYDRAFSAIFDSNITTIITGVILFILAGAGPVRGYSVTLIGGLIVSLFTAVVVTRLCFELLARWSTKLSWLKMMSLIKETHIDFMSKWKIAVSVSVIIIVASWGTLVYHGHQNLSSVLGVDFTGGSALTMSFVQKPAVEDIRAKLEGVGVKDVMIQFQKEMDSTKEFLMIKMGPPPGNLKVDAFLMEAFPDAQFKALQVDDVKSQVGSEMKKNAAWAMFWSLIAMIIYMSWRFEFGFALGAVVALFHDVLVTAGVCHLLGVQINMTVVAALMTIIGYSVNDTIVIFDRIREDLKVVRNRSFIDICNLSMNQTLSRTLLTNFMTMISVIFLLVLGGGAIRDFSVAMFIGMIAGTYSTVYIATPVVLLWYGYKTPDLGRASVST